MSQSTTSAKMDFKKNCGVCGKPLVYATEPVTKRCAFCGKTDTTLIYCPQGHYVCDACHGREAVDVLRGVLGSATSTAPGELLEAVMAHPSVPMHGPEHHAIVPAVIIAAAKNAGYPVPEGAIETAIARASKVPGGWCGYYGDCGAAVGVGIAVSVLTKATPTKGKERSLALAATSFALSRMLDDNPRCCKRATRKALEAAIEFLKDKMGITLTDFKPGRCQYTARNQECPHQDCSYF